MKVHVNLGSRSYDILVTCDILCDIGALASDLNLGNRILLVSDSNVYPLYGEALTRMLQKSGYEVATFVAPAGEESKSIDMLLAIYTAASAHDMNRTSWVLALGGGVVGDLAGYAAASFMRGIPFVQVPTSLLAMVDSSVGGKTGINLPEGKNMVGAFHQPRAVIADLATLVTLPDREYFSGMAEVVKHGIIKDPDFFCLLENNIDSLCNRDMDLLENVITQSCEIKVNVVQQDECEAGLRAILNFGHTFGHALENTAGYGALLHGEAISIGMIYAAQLSRTLLSLSESEIDRITALLKGLHLPVKAPALPWEDLLAAMNGDKKNVQATPAFVLAKSIGSVECGHEVSPSLLLETYESICSKN